MKRASSFPTAAWQEFLANYVRISPLSDEELQSYSGIIAIDFEGFTLDTVRDIGIAYLPVGFLRLKPDFSDRSLEPFRSSHHVEVYNLQIQRHRTTRESYFERPNHGKPQLVHQDDVEDTLAQVFNDLRSRHATHNARFLLTGFDLRGEFNLLKVLCPNPSQYFSAWTDVQKFVREVCQESISLADCVRACGYRSSYDRCRRLHSAANDCVRTLALLTELMSPPTPAFAENIKNRQRKIGRGPLIYCRPRPPPHEKYPFRAKLTTLDRSRLPDELSTVRRLFDYFRSYAPCAAAKCPSTAKNEPGHSKAYLCFDTEDLLLAFVRATDSSCIGGKVLSVKVLRAPSTHCARGPVPKLLNTPRDDNADDFAPEFGKAPTSEGDESCTSFGLEALFLD